MTTTDTTTSANPTTTTPDAGAAGTWQLGDRTVNRLGLGAMRLSGTPWDTQVRDRTDVLAVLRRAVELGVNHIDTAAFYFVSSRSSNELISTALQPYDDDLVIVTKVGPSRSRDGAFEDYARPEQLRAQVEENLRQLGRDHLDVVNLRWGSMPAKEGGSLADHLGALVDLRDAGLVRHVGVSNVTLEQATEAFTVAPIVCVQNQYGITDRADDAIVDLCASHGVAFVPFFSMAAGMPGALPGVEPDRAAEDAVARIAGQLGATPAQVRLAWTLHRGPHVLAIPGTGSVGHLEENVAAAAISLDDDALAQLDAIAGGAR